MQNNTNKNIAEIIFSICQSAKLAARQMALASTHDKNAALRLMANAIRNNQLSILDANQKDVELAKQKNISAAFLDRLKLNTDRIEAMAKGLEAIAELPDPIGSVLAEINRPNGLKILRVRVPIGVIGVIYESRPNVTADAAGISFKAGNAIILRGGSDSIHSSSAIVAALHQGLRQAHLPLSIVQLIPMADRQAVDEMLTMDKYIDVIIPRGGINLINYISEKSRIPLFKHLAGLCHTYIHKAANLEMAKKIVLNAKMRRTGICGATEVLLIDEDIINSHLTPILNDLIEAGCEIRGDNQVTQFHPKVKLSNDQDYDTEFLDAIIAVKIVKNLSEAIQHITTHSTMHTDAIITEDNAAAETFFNEIDSAIVVHNASTQFADGGEFGMGAEMGIATGKLHARGPVGVEQLTTFKYQVHGSGQVRG